MAHHHTLQHINDSYDISEYCTRDRAILIARVHLKLHGSTFKLYGSDRLGLVKVSHDD